MSCWVVPTIAADFWGCSIDHVLNGIRDGSIKSKTEEGFTFVDVLPTSPQPAPKRPSPPTFVAVLQVEPGDFEDLDAAVNASDYVDEDVSWTPIRRESSRLRRAPQMQLS